LPWPQGGGAAFPTRRLKPNSRAYSRGPEPIGRPTSSVSCSIPPQRKRWNRGTMSASRRAAVQKTRRANFKKMHPGSPARGPFML
jgi:hypothetical protein